MKRILVFTLIFLALILEVSAGELRKPVPAIIPAIKVGKSDTELLNALGIITKASLGGVVPGVEKGLIAILQLPKYKYNQEEEMLLFLRLVPGNNKEAITVNSIGPVEIELTDLKSNDKKIYGRYSILEKALMHGSLKLGQDIFIVNRESGCPEVVLIFTLQDFGIPLLARGIYQLQLIYSNELQDYNCWIGKIISNPILIEIQR